MHMFVTYDIIEAKTKWSPFCRPCTMCPVNINSIWVQLTVWPRTSYEVIVQTNASKMAWFTDVYMRRPASISKHDFRVWNRRGTSFSSKFPFYRVHADFNVFSWGISCATGISYPARSGAKGAPLQLEFCNVWGMFLVKPLNRLDISRSNIRYWTHYEWKRTFFRLRTQKRSLTRPFERGMGRLMWVLWKKDTAIYRECTIACGG